MLEAKCEAPEGIGTPLCQGERVKAAVPKQGRFIPLATAFKDKSIGSARGIVLPFRLNRVLVLPRRYSSLGLTFLVCLEAGLQAKRCSRSRSNSGGFKSTILNLVAVLFINLAGMYTYGIDRMNIA
jgi:hypothetical protein